MVREIQIEVISTRYCLLYSHRSTQHRRREFVAPNLTQIRIYRVNEAI